jgi:hypothetical protein
LARGEVTVTPFEPIVMRMSVGAFAPVELLAVGLLIRRFFELGGGVRSREQPATTAITKIDVLTNRPKCAPLR